MATPLQGAHFELKNSQGETVASGISGTDGIVNMGNISPGTYTLVETQAPDGYVIGGPYDVTVTDDGEITINGTAMEEFVAQDRLYPSVEFDKTDASENPLADAVFHLEDGNGNIKEATSTSDGFVTFDNVAPGTYSLTEVTPPPGYIADTNTYEVVVNEYGEITVDGEPISGFSVKNENGPALSFLKTNYEPPA